MSLSPTRARRMKSYAGAGDESMKVEIMPLGHGQVFTPRLRFVRCGRIGEIAVRSSGSSILAEHRGTDSRQQCWLCIQVWTTGSGSWEFVLIVAIGRIPIAGPAVECQVENAE